MWRVLQAWLRRPLIYREHGRAIRSIAVTTTKASRMARDPKTGRALTVEITESAAQRLRELSRLKRQGGAFDLRLSVEPGGCHGFQYHFEPVEPGTLPDPTDIVFEREGTRVVIDEVSLQYLAGSQIDYTKELIGSAFRVLENPMAVSGCGCGTSFNLSPSDQKESL